MKVNAVFQGGGVKAIGLVGGVKAAEEAGISFGQVAGTSSGAMIASFLAAGYTADEMKDMIMQTPFHSFLQTTGWFHWLNGGGTVLRLFLKKGLYSGERLEQWVRDKLKAKNVRTFGDLPPQSLRIIASDITQGRLLVLPDDIGLYGWDPNTFDVAKAVRMSTSLPFFFEPVILRKAPTHTQSGESFQDQLVYVVDGGILSNFPLWLFDHPTGTDDKAPITPVLGFSLVGRGEMKPNAIYGPLTMLQALFSTMMDAHDQRFIEDHNDFRTIKIPTMGVSTTEFNLSKEKSLELFEAGVKAGRKFFTTKWSLPAYLAAYQKYVAPSIKI